jgi:hypothetical protein
MRIAGLVGRSATTTMVLITACSGLRLGQREDIVRWQTEAARLGHPSFASEVETYDPGHASALGFAPFGLAGFYVDRPGLAVSGFLWPLSIAWVPGVARKTAEQKNYLIYREHILSLRQDSQPRVAAPTKMHRIPVDPRRAAAQLQRLDKQWAAGAISETEYLQGRQAVQDSMTDEEWNQVVTHPVQ